MRSHVLPRALPLAGLLLATLLVVLLGVEVHSLRADLRAADAREHYADTGMYTPSLELERPDGSTAVIGAPDEGAHEILFLYNTTCSFCRAALPAWKEIAGEAPAIGARVYGLSLDPAVETAAYAAEHRGDLRHAPPPGRSSALRHPVADHGRTRERPLAPSRR
jgi:cytochrome oxidase Cu insertion factor (SCO1/SenC/PrrC family)